MKFIINKNNLKGRIVSASAALAGLLVLILYLACGLTIYNESYSALLIVFAILGILLAAGTAAVPVRVGMFASYLCFLIVTIEFIVTQINYLAAVIYPLLVGTLVDDVSISASFIFTVIFCLAAFACSLAAGIITKKDFIYERVFKDAKEAE